MDNSKIKAVMEWPNPKSLQELREFLDLTRYYQRFVKNYGKLAWPLTDHLRKGNFFWEELKEHAFQSLKRVMIELPVLSLPYFSKEFVMETGAFGHSLGVVLM